MVLGMLILKMGLSFAASHLRDCLGGGTVLAVYVLMYVGSLSTLDTCSPICATCLCKTLE